MMMMTIMMMLMMMKMVVFDVVVVVVVVAVDHRHQDITGVQPHSTSTSSDEASSSSEERSESGSDTTATATAAATAATAAAAAAAKGTEETHIESSSSSSSSSETAAEIRHGGSIRRSRAETAALAKIGEASRYIDEDSDEDMDEISSRSPESCNPVMVSCLRDNENEVIDFIAQASDYLANGSPEVDVVDGAIIHIRLSDEWNSTYLTPMRIVKIKEDGCCGRRGLYLGPNPEQIYSFTRHEGIAIDKAQQAKEDIEMRTQLNE
jgi:hypothetical protein